ncbi:MAG TPA: DUF2142 domain-containing protein [Glaciibacter sp.]|nr:DUF2142 domain-containing protein [Glaciibacter sp.]
MTDLHVNERTVAVEAPRWRVFLNVFTLLLAPMMLWALASPLMSVPDEPSHAIRAVAVAHGDFTGHAETDSAWQISVTVPEYAAHTHELTCFAFQADIPASCQAPVKGDPDKPTSITTSAGINSPVYYAIVGAPSLLLSGNAALYGMRLVNAIVCAALLAGMFMSLRQLPSSRWATLGALVSVTPMVLFLSGSINPNGMEFAAAAALFAALLTVVRTPSPGRTLWGRGAIVLLSAAILGNTRSIGLLWILLAVAGALILSNRQVMSALVRRWETWLIVGGSAIVSLLAVAWYIKPPITTAAGPVFQGVGTSFRSAFIHMIIETVDYARDWIGLFGWVDRPAPAITVMVWTAAICAFLVASLALGRGRALLTVVFFALAVVLVPAVAQAAIVTESGYIWQGRYTLVLLAYLLIAGGLALDLRYPNALATPGGKRLTVAAIGLLAVAQLAAFVWTLKRYVVGEAASSLDMILAPAWQPPFGWVVLTLALTVSLGVASWVIVRVLTRVDSHVSLPVHPAQVSATAS